MNLTALVRSAVASGVLAAALPALAVNTLSFSDAPIGKMTAQDISILEAEVHRTLDEVPDGGEHHWINPGTGAHGRLSPLESLKQHDLKCRRMRVANSAGGISNSIELVFCRMPEGWKIVQ